MAEPLTMAPFAFLDDDDSNYVCNHTAMLRVATPCKANAKSSKKHQALLLFLEQRQQFDTNKDNP
jgi:hypothetical protein